MTAFLRRTYDGGGTTTSLNNAMGEFDTAFNIVSSTGWPGTVPGGSTGYIVVIDRGLITEEKILCSGNSGTAVSVATNGRGYDGTSATAHTATAIVSLCAGAIDLDEANQVTNLMGNMAAGSIPVGAGSGILATPLAIGTTGQVLSVSDGEPVWAGVGSPSLNAASIEGSFTAEGQLFAGTGNGSGKQLAKGTTGQILTVGGADASGLMWASLLTPTAQTTTYSANPGDFVQATATSGAFTVTVPITDGAITAVKKMDSTSAHAVTIVPASGHIDGNTSLLLYGQYAGYVFVGDGTNANIVSVLPSYWTAFTPTWGSTGTAPTIGDGSIMANFQQIGTQINLNFTLDPGSTTSFGSGNYYLTIPGTLGSYGPTTWFGSAQLQASSIYTLQVEGSSNGTLIFYGPTSSSSTVATRWTPSVPETFSSTSQLIGNIIYSL